MVRSGSNDVGIDTANDIVNGDNNSDITPSRRSRRPKRRELRCPVHPESGMVGTGRKYFLHLVTTEELKQRGLSHKRAQLVIQAYPVLVLSNEWLEQLWCPDCGQSHWCHVTRHERHEHTVRWASRELWQQVAHVDPMVANPSVSEFSRRVAGRADSSRRYWDN
ncbi:hypothetical protein [Synechococcus sp. CS-1332]|uniref:hypothetical protein n=1 Tax=Synechococcus sp. CS-1332 TaxID=2847972 RepID=UPI00223B7FD1|nr:hypothetical protein [Synechococcus sp. CS-1332]